MFSLHQTNLFLSLTLLVAIWPETSHGAGIQAQPEPSKFVERKVRLYEGNSVPEFLSLCVSPSDPCPLNSLTDVELKAAQLKTLKNAQSRVKNMADGFKSLRRNFIRLGYLCVILLLATYVVVVTKHIDFRLFMREWVFDGSYGFHAKILKRMKFELLAMSEAEWAAMKQAKRDAVKKRRLERESRSKTKISNLALGQSSDGSDPDNKGKGKPKKEKTKTETIREEILTSSKKQRILRKKYQTKFDEAKRKFMMEERKKFHNEQAIINAEVRRLENETKKDEYHKKLLGRFKDVPEAEKESKRERDAKKAAEKEKAKNHSDTSLHITVPTMGLLDIRRDEQTGDFRDLDKPTRTKAHVAKLQAKVLRNKAPNANFTNDLRKMEKTQKPRQIFNKITQRYEDVEDDDDD